MKRPCPPHLRSSKDLETSYEAVRAGFVALALEKNRRATPFVEEARALKAAAGQAKNAADLLRLSEIRPALLTAAAVSDKALTHLQEKDKEEAILGLINKYLEPAGTNFVEELVFRFLLTRGDALGGSMRNIGGAMAQRKLTRSIISHLRLAGKSYWWLHSETDVWTSALHDDSDIELNLRGLSWQTDSGHRTLLYNMDVPLVGSNVDLCLFNSSREDLSKDLFRTPNAYIALGELKGGIDPAGADEHWKTARTALNRIQAAFSKKGAKPYTFFVGAAIERRMAVEIWKSLKAGTIDNAANLTDDKQMASITRWICSL